MNENAYIQSLKDEIIHLENLFSYGPIPAWVKAKLENLKDKIRWCEESKALLT